MLVSSVLKTAYYSPKAGILLLLAVLAAIPLVYSLPLITGGLDDLNLVRHFDQGESELTINWVEAYTRGPLYAPPFHAFLNYPKLFYNSAGIILYPLGAVNGEDFKAVLGVWRGFSLVYGAGALIALFFLAQRVFHSNAIAFIGALLLGLTPQFLLWTVNVRPNPLEQLLIFAGLLVLVRMCERFSVSLFLVATTLGALAFASKYGGIPFMVLVPIFSFYLIWRRRTDQEEFTRIVREQARALRYLLPVLSVGMAVAAVAMILALRSRGWDGVPLIYGWTQGGLPPEKLPSLTRSLNEYSLMVNVAIWGGTIALGVGAVMVAAVGARWRAWGVSTVIRPSLSVYARLLIAFAILTALIYPLIFFLTGPAFAAHPEHFFSQVGWQFRNIALSASYGDVGAPSYLETFRQTARNFHPGWLAFVPLLGYGIYLNVRKGPDSPVERDQRIVLWAFAALAVALFLGFKSAIGIRHILPAIGILYLFAGEVVIREFVRWRRWRAVGALAVSLSAIALVLVGIGFHSEEASQDWRKAWGKPNDIGIVVGAWLTENYDKDVRIAKDSWHYYIPPQFQNVASSQDVEWAHTGAPFDQKEGAVKQLLIDFDPDVILVAQSKNEGHGPLIDIPRMLESDDSFKEHYGIREEFRSRRGGDEFGRVIVYEKVGLNVGKGRRG